MKRGKFVDDFSLIVLTALAFFLSLKSFRLTRKNERLVLFRLGKYMGIRGPGPVFLIPLFDLTVLVDLDKNVTGWRGMSPRELEEKLKSLVIDLHDNIKGRQR